MRTTLKVAARWWLSSYFLITHLALAADAGAKATINEDTGGVFSGGKAQQIVKTASWLLQALPLFPAVFLLIYSGVKMKDQDYGPAVASGIGALICGIACFVVGQLQS